MSEQNRAIVTGRQLTAEDFMRERDEARVALRRAEQERDEEQAEAARLFDLAAKALSERSFAEAELAEVRDELRRLRDQAGGS